MPAPAQTPCLYLDAGGDDAFSKECLKALANCGFPAIGFGSYNKVLEAQSAARKSLKNKKWPGDSGLDEQVVGLPKDQKAFLANGESGHMATNSMYQEPGGRGEACANRPGCAGYDANQAPCTVHQGDSTTPGTAHYDITQTEAGTAEAQQDKPGCSNDNGSLTPKGVNNCVNATSTIAVTGGQGGTPDADAEAQRLAGIKQKSADSLAGGQGAGVGTDGGGAGDKAKGKGSNASDTKPKGGGSGLSADQKKAIKCMQSYWKKKSEEARKDFSDKHRSTPDGSQKGEDGPPDPPDATKQKAMADKIAANKKKLKDMDSDDPGRQALLDQNAALRDKCRTAQADYLAWYYDNNKSPPPMTPYPPGPTPNDAGSGKDE